MERLRYVARSGGVDPAMSSPRRSRRSPACARSRASWCRCAATSSSATRRAARCGGCAPPARRPDALERVWRLADEIEQRPDTGAARRRLPDDATVVTVGSPPIAAQALVAPATSRCSRCSPATTVAGSCGRWTGPASTSSRSLPKRCCGGRARRSVAVEADACSTGRSSARWASGLAASPRPRRRAGLARRRTGRRLPVPYVEAIMRGSPPRLGGRSPRRYVSRRRRP